MKSLEFESGMDSERKVMVALFWSNRKAARTEGCATFSIKKIETGDKTYIAEGNHLLKISDEIMEDMVKTLDSGKTIKMDLSLGEEKLHTTLSTDTYSVSVEKSPEIEEEIVEKLEMEFPKKYPNLCESFKPRVTPQNK
jgi:hypothetical protein